MLGVGILFFPYIFAWFTLRKGHSQGSKVLSFGWLATLLLVGFLGGDPSPEEQKRQADRQAERQAAADAASDTAFVLHTLRDKLVDPDSANLTSLMTFRTGEKLAYCGKVNAKNRMGGFSGPTPFIISDDGIFLDDQVTADRVFQECKGETTTVVK